jgi:hypothetical protein
MYQYKTRNEAGDDSGLEAANNNKGGNDNARLVPNQSDVAKGFALIEHRVVRRDASLEGAAPHLVPIFLATRDHGCAHAIILPWAGRFRLPRGKPTVCLVGDDMAVPVIDGPSAWHAPSLRRFAKSCRRAFIVATVPVAELYAAAAHEAAVARRDVLLIETRERYEADWLSAVQRIGPHLAIHLSTTRGEGRA